MSRYDDDGHPDSRTLLDDDVDPGIAWALLALWTLACIVYCWPDG